MFFTLKNGEKVEVVTAGPTGRRLTCTCFRGSSCRQAGNFFRWSCFGEFISDPFVLSQLLPILKELVKQELVNYSHRHELEFDFDVGWDRIIEFDELTAEQFDTCEELPLNRRGDVALHLPDNLIKAPRTNVLTIVLTMRHIGHWQFGIWDIYPGEDAGEVKGDMSDEHGYIYLRWSNPGEEDDTEEELVKLSA